MRRASLSGSPTPHVETDSTNGEDASSPAVRNEEGDAIALSNSKLNELQQELGAKQCQTGSRDDKLSDVGSAINSPLSDPPSPHIQIETGTPLSPLATPPADTSSFSETIPSNHVEEEDNGVVNDTEMRGVRPTSGRPFAGPITGSGARPTARATDSMKPLPIIEYSPRPGRWTQQHKPSSSAAPSNIQLITWNVDFMEPDQADRLRTVLQYLRTSVCGTAGGSSDLPSPTCILLQELCQASFDALLADKWVRKHFAVSPPDTSYWLGGWGKYGVATLVSHNVPLSAATMLYFHDTKMGRTALFVDLAMGAVAPGKRATPRSVRIANTHLESLPCGQPMRPRQLGAIAEMLREGAAAGGALVCGDMNMIDHGDQDIHLWAGLQDACTSPKSLTWGYQPPTQFPAGRLDRVFYVPNAGGLAVNPTRVIGAGLKTASGMWASDHYGLVTEIRVA